MRELKFVAVILTVSMAGIAAANAQDKTDKAAPAVGGPTQSYVTSTGATVPRPETLPKSSPGETALDRKIRERSKRIINSICSGC